MDLRRHEELVAEVMPQGLRTPAFQQVAAAMCLMLALAGLFCNPHDAKMGKFANLDPHWLEAAASMAVVGAFGALLLAVLSVLSRRSPLLYSAAGLIGFVAVVAVQGVRAPEAFSAVIYLFIALIIAGLLAAGCVMATREEARIRRALARQESAPPM